MFVDLICNMYAFHGKIKMILPDKEYTIKTRFKHDDYFTS